MNRLIPILATLLLSALAFSLNHPACRKTKPSPATKSSPLNFPPTERTNPMLFVFSNAGDHPRLLGPDRSLRKSNRTANQNQNFSMTWDPNGYRKYVADDGSFVILKMRYYRDDMPTMRVLTQKADKSFDIDDLMEPFDDTFENSYEVVQAPFLEVV
jgi:hypothetical protein